jgi:hypothetical protein
MHTLPFILSHLNFNITMEKTEIDEELMSQRFIAEEWLRYLLNVSSIEKLHRHLDPEVEFPHGKGDNECMEWLQNELDIINKYRNCNGGKVNGKEFDPLFDTKGGVQELFFSTGVNAPNRAIPIQDFAFPFRKDFDRPKALTLSFKGPLISKIEITYNYLEYRDFEVLAKKN